MRPRSLAIAPSVRWALLAGLLALAVVAGSKVRPPADGARDPSLPQRPDVFVLNIDMLRADHMSLYGYARPTTPTLDRIARAGVWFTHARSQASWTYPSVVSLLTGLYPTSHGAHYSKVHDQYVTTVVSPRLETMATLLRQHGYATAAFMTNPLLKRMSGLDRGFDVFRDDFVREWRRTDNNRWSEESMAADNVHRAVLDWLAEDRPGPRFAYIHYIDVHGPYLHPKAFGRPCDAVGPGEAETARGSGRPRQLMVDVYDGEIQHLDALIGQFLDQLEERGILRHSLVIITSDHGEEFGDHGGHGHGHTLYEELLHVPLIIAHTDAFPFRARVDTPVAHVDLLPTLLDFLQITPVPPVAGRSLRSLIEGKGAFPQRAILSEIDNRGRPQWNATPRDPVVAYALLAPSGSKYIAGARAPVETEGASIESTITREEIYDLASDPAEMYPRADGVSLIPAFRRLLRETLAAAWDQGVAPESAPIDEQTQERLRALGYLPATPPPAANPATVPTP